MDEYQDEIDYLKIDVQGHEKIHNRIIRKYSQEYSLMIEMNNKNYYHGQQSHWALVKTRNTRI